MNTGLCQCQSLQEDLPFPLLSKILSGKSASLKLTLVCVVSKETCEPRAQGFRLRSQQLSSCLGACSEQHIWSSAASLVSQILAISSPRQGACPVSLQGSRHKNANTHVMYPPPPAAEWSWAYFAAKAKHQGKRF